MTPSTGPQDAAFGMPGRIQAPNSRPRSIALVGLGKGGAAIAQGLAREDLGALDVKVIGSGDDLPRALTDADMIFVVARPGDDLGLVPVVSRIARGRNVQVTALYIVPDRGANCGEEDDNLRTLRAGVHMLVVATDESYVAAMVAALGG